ncbi:MAG: hypothetical protein OXQ30_13375, partial [Boseongicola sp.]|nr:hypothetical protein [Boseongicola sp.]
GYLYRKNDFRHAKQRRLQKFSVRKSNIYGQNSQKILTGSERETRPTSVDRVPQETNPVSISSVLHP